MYPDSSHAAFYQRRKAFLRHIKIFLSNGDSGYRTRTRSSPLSRRQDRKSFDENEEIA
jgi:hypothetical protein